MDKQSWKQVVQVFNAVVDEPPARRGVLLDSLCAGNPLLRTEVDSLLAAHDADPDFLKSAPFAHETLDATPVDLEGSVIGAYRLVHRIAGGGMGDVYLAQRNVGGVDQTVAFKVVQRAAMSRAVLQRFLRERRILASLDHPHICRLLDAGVTEDGRPYLVMPYLEAALPITRFCDDHQLHVQQRVALFARVCQALNYAHQHLVVHADLKPDNILVTPQGEPMLLDFGISRLLSPTRDDVATTLLSGVRSRPLTPEFASPEQLRGESPTTASDIYSLGVVLFELLCGERPYEVDPQHTERALQQIALGSARPSARAANGATRRGTTANGLRRSLRGDLDNISSRAMHAEPTRRYGSAAALADDLERWSLGLPVSAHAPTAGYQLRKFVGRHRLAVAATSAALAGLMAFAITMTVLADRISRQAIALRQERDRAEVVVRFMTDLFNTTNPMLPEGGAPSAQQMLDRGIRQSASLAPEERITTLTVIGGAYIGLGQYEDARRALTEALSLQATDAHTLERAAMLRELATLEYRLDHLEKGDALAQQALAIAGALLSGDDLRLAPYLNAAGMTAMDSGRTEEAEQLLGRAIALRRARPGFEANQEYADSLRALGDVLHTVERFEEAEARYTEAVEVYERAAGPEFAMIAITLNNHSAMLRKQDRVEDALAGYRRARAIAAPSFGEQHPFVGVVTNNIARLCLRLDRVEEARRAFEQALATNRTAYPPGHPTLARSLDGLGESLFRLGQFATAVAPLREALAMFEESGRADTAEALETRLQLTQALLADGQRTAGLEALRIGVSKVWANMSADAPTRQLYQRYLDTQAIDPEALVPALAQHTS